MSVYRSPYEAYPFLCDPDGDLRCDFEIMTDRLASGIGQLAALVPERREELLRVDALVYHANPTLRTFFNNAYAVINYIRRCLLRNGLLPYSWCDRLYYRAV